MRFSVKWLVAAALVTGLVSGGLVWAAPTATTKPVDPGRYAGRWYEVARLPNKIQ
jgi:lipocalin